MYRHVGRENKVDLEYVVKYILSSTFREIYVVELSSQKERKKVEDSRRYKDFSSLHPLLVRAMR